MSDVTAQSDSAPKPERPAGAPPSREDLDYYATRPSAALDEVRLQADYLARSMTSFWRFRELGGGQRSPEAGPPKLGDHSGSGVHYVSDHPEVRILSLSFIFLLVIFESAANAYFFAKESEFGLFGGVFQAAAVSLANVATSYFIIGYWGLRHVSIPLRRGGPANRDALAVAGLVLAVIGAFYTAYAGMNFGIGWSFGAGALMMIAGAAAVTLFRIEDSRIYIKLFGLVAVGFGIIMVLLVNLSAAHYRNILDLQALGLEFPAGMQAVSFPRFFIDPEVCSAVLGSEIGNTIGSAATNAMCRPFALHSLDAMVLFALGVAISALAAFEGRKADSAFPGLSDAARHFEGARRDLQFALEDYYDSYDDVMEEIEKDFGHTLSGSEKVGLKARMDAAIANYRAMLETADALLTDEFDVDPAIVALVRRKTDTPGGDAS